MIEKSLGSRFIKTVNQNVPTAKLGTRPLLMRRLKILLNRVKDYLKKHKAYSISLSLTAFFWGILGSFSPWYIDDWTWGTKVVTPKTIIGNDARIFGNLIEVLQAGSHSVIVIGLIHAFVFFAVTLFVTKIVRSQKPSTVILFNILLLLLNKNVFFEVIIWNAGFANYFIPFVFILPVIWKLQSQSNTNHEIKEYQYFLYGALAFVSVFFLENLSIAFLLFLGGSFVIAIKKKNKHCLSGILLGTDFVAFLAMYLLSSTSKADGGSYNTSLLKSFTDGHLKEALHQILDNAKHLKDQFILFTLSENLFFITFVVIALIGYLILVAYKRISLQLISNSVKFSFASLSLGAISLAPLIIIPSPTVNCRVFFPFIMVEVIFVVYLYSRFIEVYFEILRERLEKRTKLLLYSVLVLSSSLGLVNQLPMYMSAYDWQSDIYSQVDAVKNGSESIVYYHTPAHAKYWYYGGGAALQYEGSGWSEAFKRYYSLPNTTKIVPL
jgi:hypothetical protein